jgi:hypothetical protein
VENVIAGKFGDTSEEDALADTLAYIKTILEQGGTFALAVDVDGQYQVLGNMGTPKDLHWLLTQAVHMTVNSMVEP